MLLLLLLLVSLSHSTTPQAREADLTPVDGMCVCVGPSHSQDVYQQTHPVLFSDRAIYVIVFSLRAQSLSTAELTRHVMNVSVRCKDAPILIVGTHADVVGGGGASVSLATLKQRFPQVCVLAPLPPPLPILSSCRPTATNPQTCLLLFLYIRHCYVPVWPESWMLCDCVAPRRVIDCEHCSTGCVQRHWLQHERPCE